jgi:phosphate transport system protein
VKSAEQPAIAAGERRGSLCSSGMVKARRHFHEELEALELDVVAMGELAERALGKAMDALATVDTAVANEVIAEDDQIDERYLSVERRWLEVMALQTPVATDLRLMSALLHVNMHLERVGDMAVNIAKIAVATRKLSPKSSILARLQEMADVVRPMIRTALEAFVRRDLRLATSLPAMDDPVDRLNREMYREVAACAGDLHTLEWAVRMMVVSRQLERVGDHAVDIAEQVAFLLTGDFQEFTDASHPEVGPPDVG